MIYLTVKVLHIAAVMTWIAGMIALALATTTAATGRLEAQDRRLIAAIRQWDRRVTSPAMGAAWILGLTMAVTAEWFPDAWLLAKLALAGGLSALHGMQAGTLRRLVNDPAQEPPRLVRSSGFVVLGAVPVILFLVVVKPF